MRQSLCALAAALSVVVLGGCAAKQFSAMPMTQPDDDQLTCTQIQDQIAKNEQAAKILVKKDKNVESGNAAKTVLSATPFIGILSAMAIDLSNEEQVKARAIIDRNERLTYLKKQKGCTQ